MKITQNEIIKVDQKHILKRFNVLIRNNEKTSYNTPMEQDLKLTKTEGNDMTTEQASYAHKFPYQNIIGGLLYLSMHTHPDIAHAS